MQWMKLPSKTYFERDSIQYLQKCRDVERVMIVTDHAMVELGFLDRIIEQLDLRRNKVVYQIFADVEPDPDITKPAEEREIGGLGIYIVKKSMDEVLYRYEDGQNILTIRKAF